MCGVPIEGDTNAQQIEIVAATILAGFCLVRQNEMPASLTLKSIKANIESRSAISVLFNLLLRTQPAQSVFNRCSAKAGAPFHDFSLGKPPQPAPNRYRNKLKRLALFIYDGYPVLKIAVRRLPGSTAQGAQLLFVPPHGIIWILTTPRKAVFPSTH